MFNTNEIGEIKDLFLTIWKIDNPSWSERQVWEFILKFLSKNWIKSIIDKSNNIFFKVKWGGEPVLLNSHLDSVNTAINKEPVFDWENFFSKWDTVLWADDLAWVVAILYAIQYLEKQNIEHKLIEVLFTSMEEIWWVWLKQFKFSSIKSKTWVVVDSTDKLWSLILSSPSKINFKITCTWIPTHWKDIAKWVSSVKMMGDLISLLPLWVVKKWLLLNFWKINWWKSLNTVPWETKLDWYLVTFSEWEIRWDSSSCQKVVDFMNEKIAKIKKKHPKWKINFKYELVRNWYTHNKSEQFISDIKNAIKHSKLRPRLVKTFWTSDANTINAMWIKVAMIWMWITWAHTSDEKISLYNIVKLTEILVNYLKV